MIYVPTPLYFMLDTIDAHRREHRGRCNECHLLWMRAYAFTVDSHERYVQSRRSRMFSVYPTV